MHVPEMLVTVVKCHHDNVIPLLGIRFSVMPVEVSGCIFIAKRVAIKRVIVPIMETIVRELTHAYYHPSIRSPGPGGGRSHGIMVSVTRSPPPGPRAPLPTHSGRG